MAIPELKEMLEDTKNVSPQLVELQIQLLRKGRKWFQREKWEKALIKFCHQYSSVDAWELERFGYKKSKLSVKLQMLKRLLESQFDSNVKFKAEVNKEDALTLRLMPIGRDIKGHMYWFQLDRELNMRLYQEDADEESSWNLVCENRDQLIQLLENLEGLKFPKDESSSACSENGDSNLVAPRLPNIVQQNGNSEPISDGTKYVKTEITDTGQKQSLIMVKELTSFELNHFGEMKKELSGDELQCSIVKLDNECDLKNEAKNSELQLDSGKKVETKSLSDTPHEKVEIKMVASKPSISESTPPNKESVPTLGTKNLDLKDNSNSRSKPEAEQSEPIVEANQSSPGVKAAYVKVKPNNEVSSQPSDSCSKVHEKNDLGPLHEEEALNLSTSNNSHQQNSSIVMASHVIPELHRVSVICTTKVPLKKKAKMGAFLSDADCIPLDLCSATTRLAQISKPAPEKEDVRSVTLQTQITSSPLVEQSEKEGISENVTQMKIVKEKDVKVSEMKLSIRKKMQHEISQKETEKLQEETLRKCEEIPRDSLSSKKHTDCESTSAEESSVKGKKGKAYKSAKCESHANKKGECKLSDSTGRDLKEASVCRTAVQKYDKEESVNLTSSGKSFVKEGSGNVETRKESDVVRTNENSEFCRKVLSPARDKACNLEEVVDVNIIKDDTRTICDTSYQTAKSLGKTKIRDFVGKNTGCSKATDDNSQTGASKIEKVHNVKDDCVTSIKESVLQKKDVELNISNTQNFVDSKILGSNLVERNQDSKDIVRGVDRHTEKSCKLHIGDVQNIEECIDVNKNTSESDHITKEKSEFITEEVNEELTSGSSKKCLESEVSSHLCAKDKLLKVDGKKTNILQSKQSNKTPFFQSNLSTVIGRALELSDSHLEQASKDSSLSEIRRVLAEVLDCVSGNKSLSDKPQELDGSVKEPHQEQMHVVESSDIQDLQSHKQENEVTSKKTSRKHRSLISTKSAKEKRENTKGDKPIVLRKKDSGKGKKETRKDDTPTVSEKEDCGKDSFESAEHQKIKQRESDSVISKDNESRAHDVIDAEKDSSIKKRGRKRKILDKTSAASSDETRESVDKVLCQTAEDKLTKDDIKCEKKLSTEDVRKSCSAEDGSQLISKPEETMAEIQASPPRRQTRHSLRSSSVTPVKTTPPPKPKSPKPVKKAESETPKKSTVSPVQNNDSQKKKRRPGRPLKLSSAKGKRSKKKENDEDGDKPQTNENLTSTEKSKSSVDKNETSGSPLKNGHVEAVSATPPSTRGRGRPKGSGRRRGVVFCQDENSNSSSTLSTSPVKRSVRIQKQNEHRMNVFLVEQMELEQKRMAAMVKKKISLIAKQPVKPVKEKVMKKQNITVQQNGTPKRRPGRPKKVAQDSDYEEDKIADDDEDDNSQDRLSSKKKRKRHRNRKKHHNPWDVSSESSTTEQEEEFEEEEYEEEEEPLKFDENEDEFACEEQEECAEPVVIRRARTLKRVVTESDMENEEEKNDDKPCGRCGQKDHPEWILLCDKCDSGYHTACLKPPLMIIPDGDWFCPPCEHSFLCQKLHEELKNLDQAFKKKEREELRKQRLAYVGISLDNVLKPEKKEIEDEEEEGYKEEEEDMEQFEDEREHKEKIKKKLLYNKRSSRNRKTVSYQFKEYDNLIATALQEEIEEQRKYNALMYGEGAAAAEEEDVENEEKPPLISSKKKKRKLNDLSFTSEEDNDNDSDEYKGSSKSDSEASERTVENVDSNDSDWTASRSSRARRRRRGDDFVVDDDYDSDEDAYKPLTRRAAQKKISYKEVSSDDEDGKKASRKKSSWREPLETDESEEDEWRSSKSKRKKRRRVRKFSESSEETEASYNSESEDEYRKKRRRLSSRSEEDDDDEKSSSSKRKTVRKHSYKDSDSSEDESKSQKKTKKKSDEEEEDSDEGDGSNDEEEEEEEEESSEEETLIGTKRQIIRSDDEDEMPDAEKANDAVVETKETTEATEEKSGEEESQTKQPAQEKEDPENKDEAEQKELSNRDSTPVERKGVIVHSNTTPKRRIVKEETSSESEDDKDTQDSKVDTVEDLSVHRDIKREDTSETEARFPPSNSLAKTYGDPYSVGAATRIEGYGNRPKPLKPSMVETYTAEQSPSKLTSLDSYPQSSRGPSANQFERGTPSPHSRSTSSPEYRAVSDQYRPQGCFQYGGNQQNYYPPSYGASPLPSPYPTHGTPPPTEEEYRNYPPGPYPPMGGPPHFYGGQGYYPPPPHDEQGGPMPPNYPPGGPYPYYGQSGHPPNGGFMIDNLLRSRNPEGGGEEDDLTGVTDIVSYITQE